MSAPEVQVRVTQILPGWVASCSGCAWTSGPYSWDVTARTDADRHPDSCPTFALARLQARWDARDEALRDLAERWRESSRREGGTLDDLESCADELERAIGGGE